jgi:hypothetical protein
MPAMLATKREGLARRAARNDNNVAKPSVVKGLHIAFKHRPLMNGEQPVSLIPSERLASLVIPLHDCGVVESGV